jgi:hypothetical protein
MLPKKSSLKKKKPDKSVDEIDNGLNIYNPTFYQESVEGTPQLQRTASLKKVRIQTHSTDV